MSRSVSTRTIDAAPADVYDVICDPTTYPDWLVGAQHIHHVSEDWPSVGSRFMHQIGVGPLSTPGTSTVRELEDQHLRLSAGMGPLGEAVVDLFVHRNGDGCRVTLIERPRGGLIRLTDILTGPVVREVIRRRNDHSLDALEDVVRSRAGDVDPSAAGT